MDRITLMFTGPGQGSYYNAFPNPWKKFSYNKRDLDKTDAVVFIGGADLDPSYYGDDRHQKTQSGVDGERDAREFEVFLSCLEANVPMIGICRGAQVLTAFSGGALYQHVTYHTHPHKMKVVDGKEMQVNSTHHQMMYPWTAPHHELLGWAEGVSNDYDTGGKLSLKTRLRHGKEIEPEVVYYPHTRCLCVQYHPERMTFSQDAYSYFMKMVMEKVI